MTDVALPALPKLTFEQAAASYPGVQRYYDGQGLVMIDPLVGGQFKLAPNAVFLAADVREPFVFMAQVAGRRTNVVVGREYGDLSWPAYVKRQRKSVTSDVRRIVTERMADVTAWIAESQKRLDALALEGRVEARMQDQWERGVITADEYRQRLGHEPIVADDDREDFYLG